MKTKEFIAMLQKEDPSGEGYLRMYGGVPSFAEVKEGYWDGPYQYIDDEGNFITSTKGYKIDIHFIDIDNFIERLIDIHDENNWLNIKSKFKFDLSSTSSINKDREDRILKQAKESFDEMSEIYHNLYNVAMDEAIEHTNKGWTWFQNKEVDKNKIPNMHYYYTWKIFDENGKSQGSNIHNTESILKSGLWNKHDNNVMPGYYQWIKE